MSEFSARLECSAYLATLERARSELSDMLRTVNDAIARLEKFQPKRAIADYPPNSFSHWRPR